MLSCLSFLVSSYSLCLLVIITIPQMWAIFDLLSTYFNGNIFLGRILLCASIKQEESFLSDLLIVVSLHRETAFSQLFDQTESRVTCIEKKCLILFLLIEESIILLHATNVLCIRSFRWKRYMWRQVKIWMKMIWLLS